MFFQLQPKCLMSDLPLRLERRSSFWVYWHWVRWKYSPDLAKIWTKWFQELQELEKLSITRCYTNKPFTDCSCFEIHAFADTSQKAYASAFYLRAVFEDRAIQTSLIMSKTRVALVKKVTLPRVWSWWLQWSPPDCPCTFFVRLLNELFVGQVIHQHFTGLKKQLPSENHLWPIMWRKCNLC